MNCQQFRENLDDYRDDALEPDVQAAARRHTEACAECRQALQAAESRDRALRATFDQTSANLRLSREVRQRIFAAATPPALPPLTLAWRWFMGHPLQALAPVLALVIVIMFNLQLRQRGGRAGESYTIDVPAYTEVHVSQMRDGIVIDSVVTRVVESHAVFSVVR